jgi:cyclin-dependent kinase
LKDAYNEACEAREAGIAESSQNLVVSELTPSEGGTTIGKFENCFHIANGIVSEVYKAKLVALKVVTETRDVEPHNAALEVKILNSLSHPSIITLNSTFKDQHSRLVLVFPYMPYTLSTLLGAGSLPSETTKSVFRDLFSALIYLHGQDIIHRDVKPSNLLLASPTGPAYLSDFGTAWHPTFSLTSEPPDHKVLEVGTSSYRAPETLFGNRFYNTSLDMWAAGTMLAECLRSPPKLLFESRAGHEDGNQLGLILSIFRTIGTPLKETWPEAINFTTPPFEWYQMFPAKKWEELLPGTENSAVDLVKGLITYESGNRLTAAEVC